MSASTEVRKAAQDLARCPSWCQAPHDGDPTCRGPERYVPLSMEEGYPVDAIDALRPEFDPPRIGAHAYRRQQGCHPAVYVHVYRPSDQEHLNLDDNLFLTLAEAEELIAALQSAVSEATASTMP